MIIKKGGNHFGHMKTLHIRESLPHEDPLSEHLHVWCFPIHCCALHTSLADVGLHFPFHRFGN